MDKITPRQVNFAIDRIQVVGTQHMIDVMKEDGGLQHLEELDRWSASMLIDAINAQDDHAFDDAYYGYQVQGDNI